MCPDTGQSDDKPRTMRNLLGLIGLVAAFAIMLAGDAAVGSDPLHTELIGIYVGIVLSYAVLGVGRRRGCLT